MKGKRLWKILAIVVVILSLVWAATVVLARPPAQGPSSEDGELSPDSANGPRVTEVIGDDPDEDGYVGPVALDTDSSAFPSEPGVGNASHWDQFFSEPQPDEDGYTGPVPSSVESNAPLSEPAAGNAPNWDQFFLEPQPDEDDYYVSAAADVNAGFAPTFSYVFVAGTALRPRDSDTAWNYAGFGCVSALAGNDLFNVHLDIPEGSRIDYLRIFYYDTSSSNSNAYMNTYDGAGGFRDIATVASDGNSGYGTILSGFVGEVVDYEKNSYALSWAANQTGSSMQLCGFRVAYRLPD